jgi:ABC-type transport system involved in cytochrome c biogenesis permease component
MLLQIHTCNQEASTPAGWTATPSSPVSTGTANAAGGTRMTSFYRWWEQGDTAPTVTIAGGTVSNGIITGYRGVHALNPFDATPVATILAAASTTLSMVGITTTTESALIHWAVARDQDLNSTTTVTSYSNDNLRGIVEVHDQVVNTGVGGGVWVGYGYADVAGDTGTLTIGQGSSIAVGLTIALRPAPEDKESNLTDNTLVSDIGSIQVSQEVSLVTSGVGSIGSTSGITVVSLESVELTIYGNSANVYTSNIHLSQILSNAISGNSTLASLGTLTPSQTFFKDISLSGSSANTLVGSILPLQNVIVSPIGTFSLGSTSNISTSQAVSVIVLGNTTTITQGDESTSGYISSEVLGVSSVGVVGPISVSALPVITTIISSNTSSSTTGTISVSQSVSRNVSGNTSIMASGTVEPYVLQMVSIGITGVLSTVEVGSLYRLLNTGITGTLTSTTVRALAPTTGVEMSGTNTIATTSPIITNQALLVPTSGVLSNTLQGYLKVGIEALLQGNTAIGIAGSSSPAITVGIRSTSASISLVDIFTTQEALIAFTGNVLESATGHISSTQSFINFAEVYRTYHVSTVETVDRVLYIIVEIKDHTISSAANDIHYIETLKGEHYVAA